MAQRLMIYGSHVRAPCSGGRGPSIGQGGTGDASCALVGVDAKEEVRRVGYHERSVSVKHRVWLALAGSMAFWLPLVLLEVFSRNGNFNIVLANTIPLLTVAGLYWVLRKRHPDEGRVMSLSFLAGIYGLGPLMIWLAWKCARRRLRRVSWTTLALLVASIFGPAALHPLFGYVEWYARAVIAVSVALGVLAVPRRSRS
jgi:uncharacterized membrane protein YfcA